MALPELSELTQVIVKLNLLTIEVDQTQKLINEARALPDQTELFVRKLDEVQFYLNIKKEHIKILETIAQVLVS